MIQGTEGTAGWSRIRKMTFDERTEFLRQSIESHDRQIGELTAQVGELTRNVNKLVSARNQEASATRILARIA